MPASSPIKVGYTLSSEEHPPLDLVRNAGSAEEAGFDFVSISDHFHPWIDAQGHSPFVWSVIGGIAAATEEIGVGTGVTCPIGRIHPAIIAHAAATAGCLLGNRFVFGVGTGEALNEHILADRWPEYEVRAERLVEAVELIRLLWKGDVTSHHGRHFRVENARIYDLPEALPPIVIAAGGPRTAAIAAEVGDGLWLSSVDADTITAYREAGGKGSIYCQVGVCWGPDRDSAIRTAHEIWPTGGIHGQAMQELPSPAHFAELAGMVTPEAIAASMPCGPDVGAIVAAVRSAMDAGVTHVYIHQIGFDQDAFLDMARTELLPEVRR